MSRWGAEVYSALQSRWVVAALLGFWIVAATTSAWWLVPGTDDGFYLYQILAFVHAGSIAVPFLDEWWSVYTNLPGYPVLQGLFFWLWDLVGLPISVTTHRAFQIACLVLLMLLSARLLHGAAAGGRGRLAVALFLLLLGVTPFALDALFLRPELLGVLTTVVSLLFFARGWRSDDPRSALAAGLALGIAVTTHPTLVYSNGVVAIAFAGALLMRRRYVFLAWSMAATVVPVALAIAYFLTGGEEALAQLGHHIQGRAPGLGGGVLAAFEYVREAVAAPSAATLFFGIPFAAFILLFVAAAATLAVTLFAAVRQRTWPFDAAAGGIHAFFLGGTMAMVLDSAGHVQLFTVVAFATVLSLAQSASSLWNLPADPLGVA